MTLEVEKTKASLLFYIIVLIGFQQFPVIRVGGSLKIYEILAIVLLFLNILTFKNLKFQSHIQLGFFTFFVISPVLSLAFAYIFLGYPRGFFAAYPEGDSFKFNYYVFPILQLLYMFFNYAVISNLINGQSRLFQKNYFKRLVKAIIYIGTLISLYSVISMFTVDVILLLPSFIQNKSEYILRSYGMSQEPSFYVLYQVWVCLITYYSKPLFSRGIWRILFFINAISLIFTFSTTLVAFVGIIILSTFIFKTPLKYKLALIGGLLATTVVIYFALQSLNLFGEFEYVFITKATSFFSSPEHTMDSGGFRSYTSRIGLRIFGDYPLTGVGVGNSIYYMYIYEFQMGIEFFGEKLKPGSFPQNMFSSVLSEQGLIGGLSMLAILILCFFKLWKVRNYDDYTKVFLIGFLFNIATMLTIAPVYSLFLWVFVALGIGYANTISNTKSALVS